MNQTAFRDLAIALGYKPGSDQAPQVLASGAGPLAERIRGIAERLDIPVHRDADLAELLKHVPLKDEIPADLYPAVAEILAFLWMIARSQRGS